MEFAETLPKQIGNVKLNYEFYPGEDIYSDGAIEDEILEITKNAARIEYPKIIEEKNSWPVLYHLSALRGNIVDWLPITKDMKVLEIGSGCGAITDKLSEKAGKVTCVDLSAKRSMINAYRNQDRDNIEIYVGNFNDIEPSLDCDYDLVCLIGVFEYGNSYIHTKAPYEDFFQIMQKHKKSTGLLVIAIENKFGLKYWAGCKEDHVGTYFSGLEGYPEGGSARTFTKRGLEKIFGRCGETNYHFYYPYPDYKFPTTIYSDRRLPYEGELTDNMRNFDRDRMVLFREKYVFDSTIEDDYFDLFSNSYMVVIGELPQTIYSKYSNDRDGRYELRTDIVETSAGKVVRKVPMTEEARAHVREMEAAYQALCERYEGSGLHINPCMYHEQEGYAEFPFEQGTTLETLMDQCLSEKNLDGFQRLFDKYWELVSYRKEGYTGNIADYDLIFANILVDGENWTVIDYEWTTKETVEDKEIAFRAIYCYILEDEKRNELNLDYIMQQLNVTEDEAEEYRHKEAIFQKKVTGKRKSMGEIRAAIGTYAVDPKKLMEEHLQEILDERIQLYYDRGQGFCESDSRYVPDVYVKERQIETTLTVEGDVRNFRVDPADKPCVVKLQQLLWNGMPVAFEKKFIETNGKQVKPGTYLFATADPNLVLHVEALVMAGMRAEEENQVELKMEVSPVSAEAAEEMISMIKKLFLLTIPFRISESTASTGRGEQTGNDEANYKEGFTGKTKKRISEGTGVSAAGLRFLDQGSGDPSFGFRICGRKIREVFLCVRLYRRKLSKMSDK